jgi:hypothetical protein
MHTSTILQAGRTWAARAFAITLALFSLSAVKTYAATDWSAIQTIMQADGTMMPGDVLRFELLRQDLSMTVDGAAVPSYQIAAVTNGFVAFKEMAHGQFYADGSLPTQESELPGVVQALLAHAHLRITAIENRLINESPRLIWVHFEGTGTGAQLATWIAATLVRIHYPQVGVTVIPGVNNIIDPAKILPPKFLKLFDEGFVEQFTGIFAFYLPRPNESGIMLGDHVQAETGLGVGQSFYIQVPFSGGSNVTLNIDFALRVEDLIPVQNLLYNGGFTITGQGNNFVDESRRLFFLHATATGDGLALGQVLYNVIQVIQNNQNALGNR